MMIRCPTSQNVMPIFNITRPRLLIYNRKVYRMKVTVGCMSPWQDGKIKYWQKVLGCYPTLQPHYKPWPQLTQARGRPGLFPLISQLFHSLGLLLADAGPLRGHRRMVTWRQTKLRAGASSLQLHHDDHIVLHYEFFSKNTTNKLHLSQEILKVQLYNGIVQLGKPLKKYGISIIGLIPRNYEKRDHQTSTS